MIKDFCATAIWQRLSVSGDSAHAPYRLVLSDLDAPARLAGKRFVTDFCGKSLKGYFTNRLFD